MKSKRENNSEPYWMNDGLMKKFKWLCVWYKAKLQTFDVGSYNNFFVGVLGICCINKESFEPR